MLDLAIKGGSIIDGTGKPAFRADVGISEERIVEVGENVSSAEVVLDASHKVVSPGFIDVHSHSDLTLLVDPQSQSKLRQGVTTEVVGNCGFGVAPISREHLSEFAKFWTSSGSEWFDIKPTWQNFGEYLIALEDRKPSLNVAVLAAHGTIRFAVMGDSPRRASEEELLKMQALTEDCMKSGACGFSSGLRYTPSCYADPQELARLCSVVKQYGGVYATHMRSEGDNGSWEEAVLEAVDVARKTGVSLQISHLKALSRNVWNTSGNILRLLESLRDEGIRISADQYPYDAAHAGLTVFLPKWITLEELSSLDDERRKRVVDHVRKIVDVRGGPTRVTIVSSPQGRFDGKDIAEISREFRISPEETILKLIVDCNGEISMFSRSMNEDDIRRIMRAEYVMVGTDGYSVSPEGPSAVGIPHPRSFGTYPRVLGRYVRELGVLGLEDAVRKMTSLPAEKFHFENRGEIKEGAYADISVFDPETVIDESTFSHPTKYPRGIEYVLVNGKVTINSRDRETKAQNGKVLRGRLAQLKKN